MSHVRRPSLALAISVSTTVGCNLLTGADALSVVFDEPTDAPEVAFDGGAREPDTGIPRPSVIVDAAPYDAGDAGYIELTGNWAGNWTQALTPVGGDITFQLMQDGGSLSGTGEVDGPCGCLGAMNGNFVATDTVTGKFTSPDNAVIMNVSWTVSADVKRLAPYVGSVQVNIRP